jgi:phage-related protein (TIGR01555 family)
MADAEKEVTGRAKGGKATASKLSSEQKTDRAKKAAAARWAKKPEVEVQPKRGTSKGMIAARDKARESTAKLPKFAPPLIMNGVVPKGKASAIAMDYAPGVYDFANSAWGMNSYFQPFPGYPYLAGLTTRPEYRAFADCMSSELTREWVKFKGSNAVDGDGESEQDQTRIPELEDAVKRFNLKGIFKEAAMHDCFFGRAQIMPKIRGADEELPLILSNKTVKKGTLERFTTIEAMWTTPNAYNANDPTAPDFYTPRGWFVLGNQVHASRILTVITRPLPDMLKPAYNFSGMSISQLAEPYVNNWLRTRQSVSDLINNFSITALKTNMAQVLQGCDDASDLYARADMFTLTRSNRGLMLLDKDSEELDQVNTPLSGLHELQAQSQEQMCSVSRMPAIILTGISPGGLNASSDSEIRVFYDWIASQQEAFWRHPLDTCIKLIMLDLWGEIDDTITFEFNPLWQISAKEESEIRSNNATAAATYVDRGVLSAEEIRENLAADPNSGFSGIDISDLPKVEQDDKDLSNFGNPFGGGQSEEKANESDPKDKEI